MGTIRYGKEGRGSTKKQVPLLSEFFLFSSFSAIGIIEYISLCLTTITSTLSPCFTLTRARGKTNRRYGNMKSRLRTLDTYR